MPTKKRVFEMADTTGITGKRKTYLWLPILLIHNFGRLAMGIAGALFIILGAIALVYSCYELIDYLTQGEKTPIAVFVQCAEYFLITLTFVLVGQAVMNLACDTESKTEDLGKLKESLLAMIISISGVAFIELILGCETAADLGIDILYVGLGIASVIVALGIFIHLGMHKNE
ncbi:putative membrane protein YqhA [Candidatus Methanophagaceae archaeon]|nr:putative membrane protein YqhA [Methanophagales archaeon]